MNSRLWPHICCGSPSLCTSLLRNVWNYLYVLVSRCKKFGITLMWKLGTERNICCTGHWPHKSVKVYLMPWLCSVWRQYKTCIWAKWNQAFHLTKGESISTCSLLWPCLCYWPLVIHRPEKWNRGERKRNITSRQWGALDHGRRLNVIHWPSCFGSREFLCMVASMELSPSCCGHQETGFLSFSTFKLYKEGTSWWKSYHASRKQKSFVSLFAVVV